MSVTQSWRLPVLAGLVLALMQACRGVEDSGLGDVSGGMSRAAAYERASAMSALGRQLFSEPALSASGRLACASCHSPDHRFGPADAAVVKLGGGDMRQPGLRAVPTLTYLQATPSFTEHFFDNDDEGDESIDNGPSGGLTWDGRVDLGAAQALIPLLSPFEMGNKDAREVVAEAVAAGYGPSLQAIFGEGVLADHERGLTAIAQTLEAFEQDYKSFYPYSSKYDAYLAGKARLTPQEARGLDLFDDPEKGNCASCHRSQRGLDGTPPQFTDFGLIALGLPRNPEIPANRDPRFHDLGLCGPLRTDLSDRPDYCGLFKSPSLRNVALRQSFFHNGVIHSLGEAVAFYVERDTRPEKWYPRRPDGSVDKFNDLPERYWDNINMDPPFGTMPGDPPALSPAEIDDVVAFLRTLTDGYQTP